MDEVRLRPAAPDDATGLGPLQRRSRRTAMPWLADLHDDEDCTRFVRDVLLPTQRVVVAQVAGVVVGFSAVDGEWLGQLYVAPEAQGAGVGRALLEDAVGAGARRLFVFTRNARARRFYEAAGWVLQEQGDGRDNEEREPDCTYVLPAP